MDAAARQIDQLRQWRERREYDTSVGPLIARKGVEIERARKSLGSFVDLWEGVVPADLACHTRVNAVRSGVAYVTVDSSSTAYELDRRLREGLEQDLRRAFGKTLVRVRVTVGELA